jgi:Uma2 family endonuclease
VRQHAISFDVPPRDNVKAMAAAVSLFPVQPRDSSEEPRILLTGVPWSLYVTLRDGLDTPGLRMTYLEGALEIMSPSRNHEVSKTQIARLLELFCLERDIPLYGFGSTTFRKEEKQRGLEPDECYSRGRDTDVPDVALEVIVTHGAIDKLEVYRGLGVREVWLFESGAFRVLALGRDGYAPIGKCGLAGSGSGETRAPRGDGRSGRRVAGFSRGASREPLKRGRGPDDPTRSGGGAPLTQLEASADAARRGARSLPPRAAGTEATPAPRWPRTQPIGLLAGP